MTEVWSEVLGRTDIGPSDNFFDLGGDSIAAVRVGMNAAETVGYALPVELVLEHQTIAELAMALAGGLQQAGRTDSADERRLIAAMFRDSRLPVEIGGPKGAGGDAVLVTGATGLLGPRIVHALLDRGFGPIRCLVRAGDESEARDRLERRGVPTGVGGVTPIVGDLGRARFGLERTGYEELAGGVGTVFHAGAKVDLFASYADLRASNVVGTVEAVRFAAVAGARLMYVSTISTVSPISAEVVDPLVLSEHPDWGPQSGYGRTKWVGEQLVLQARSRGVSADIIRTSRIGGDSETGAWSNQDALARLLIASLELEAAPLLEFDCDVIPADVVGRAIVAIADLPPGTFNLRHPEPLPFLGLLDEVERVAGPLRRLPVSEWLEEVAAAGERKPSLLATVPMVERVVATAGRRAAPTSNAIARTGVRAPDVQSQVAPWLEGFAAAGTIRPLLPGVHG